MTARKNNWEGQFDKEFNGIFNGGNIIHTTSNSVHDCHGLHHIKDFIRDLLRASRLELAGKIMGAVPEVNPILVRLGGVENYPDSHGGWTEARDSLRTALKREGLIE